MSDVKVDIEKDIILRTRANTVRLIETDVSITVYLDMDDFDDMVLNEAVVIREIMNEHTDKLTWWDWWHIEYNSKSSRVGVLV